MRSQAEIDCKKAKVLCGVDCAGGFCAFPKKCGSLHFCERCTKVNKVCEKVKTPCGDSGLECGYGEKCVAPCSGKDECPEGSESHECVGLPKEEYTACEEVVNSRCMPADKAGKPLPFVSEKSSGVVAEGWKEGDKCGVAYCPKDRVCMEMKEKSCVGQVEVCGDIDCPVGYVCKDKLGCEQDCVQVTKEQCVAVNDDMEPAFKLPFCKSVLDCE